MVILDFLTENKISWGFFQYYLFFELKVVILDCHFFFELSYYFGLGSSLGFPILREGEQHIWWSFKLSHAEKRRITPSFSSSITTQEEEL